MRNTEKSKLKKAVAEVKCVISLIVTQTITETNRLFLAGANVVAARLGFKAGGSNRVKEPWWLRRIKSKIKQLRKEISRLEKHMSGEIRKSKISDQLKRKYKIDVTGPSVVLEELKQRLTAQAAKLKRYQERHKQYRQNRMFETNQRRLFEEIEGMTREDGLTPDAEESKNLWNGIWGKSVDHNEGAEWLRDVDEQLADVEKQNDVKITVESVRKCIRKIANLKSPGPDCVQGYWIKNFTSLQKQITKQLDDCLQLNSVPAWLTTGRTVLIVKNKELGSIATNFRPITCLPLIWKLLTGILADELYQHLESKELLPEEQKGCRRDARGTKDQLLIDKTILKNCRRRLTGLGMAWIDFTKAFDMVPHSWIIKCMTIFGVASNVTRLLENSMKGWRTELSSGGVRLGDVNIRRGIFQGDSLSPLLFVLSLIPLTLVLRKVKAGYDLGDGNGVINHLLFMDDLKVYGKNQNQVDTLVQTIRVVTTDMQMEFGINKCAMHIMKRGRLTHSEGITLPDNLQIRGMKEDDDGYKYLGVLEVEGIKHLEMKELVRKEYFSRVKKILKSKLNGGNTIKAINSRAVSIIRYGAGIVDWTKEELQEMDR